jgi:alkylation response protein AidB-like acyl-CoA dehydrogenase
MRFVLKELAGLDEICSLPDFQEQGVDIVDAVLEEAAKFASGVLSPLNVAGDQAGSVLANKQVKEAPGFAEAYQQFIEGGWMALSAKPEYGGMGFPEVVEFCVGEMWASANTSFSLCPMLGQGAMGAMVAHASDELKAIYLEKMVSGEWTGTMNLTEPQAGSDLAAVRTRAVPEGDHYLISGTKIFITWGDHGMTDNIIHLVLARTPDAPEGVKGISLFVVPKFLVNPDGSLGERNDAYAVSVEHKLGIHASPTCVMSFGDNGGAVGYLVGEENRGLSYMFTMMNHARIGVGFQGIAISEAAYGHALPFARERVQGAVAGVEGKSGIINHPDVRRMLMLMKALTEATRAVGLVAAGAFDRAHHAASDNKLHQARGELLTPVVKAWSTEVCQEVSSLGVQVFGGMGFVEETGAAQFLRDARITTIYEGTTGIQANDLVGRKLIRDNGAEVGRLLSEIRAFISEQAEDLSALATATDALEKTTGWLLENYASDPRIPGAAAFNYLMQFGTVVGGWQMARAAVIAAAKKDEDPRFYGAKIITARFYRDHVLPRAAAYAAAAMADCADMMALEDEQF